MGVLNRKKGGAGGSNAPHAEFFNAAEASQLNTLLRGSGPTASGEANSQGAAPSGEPQVRQFPLQCSERARRATEPRAAPLAERTNPERASRRALNCANAARFVPGMPHLTTGCRGRRRLSTRASLYSCSTPDLAASNISSTFPQSSDGGRPRRSTAGARAKAAEAAKLAEQAKAAQEKAAKAAAKEKAAEAKATANGRSTRSRSAASGDLPGLSGDGSAGAKLNLPTLSQGMGEMSDGYLKDLGIGGGAAAPNFFREGMENDTKTVSMGPPPSRGWAGDVSNMMLTKSIGSAGRSAGRSGAASGSGGAAGYFNNNELSELFSIVRGKSAFADKKKTSKGTPARGGASGASGVPGTAVNFDSLNVMPDHMKALPPIRTKSMDARQLLVGGVETPRSGDLQLPGSADRLVTGLTPHGMLMGTGLTPRGTGLTPTGLTPGSLAGFPGMDHFSMTLGEGTQGGLLPGMPGWAQAGQDEPPDSSGGKGKKRKAGALPVSEKAKTSSKGSGGKAPKVKGKGKGKANDEDDDIPLSGLVRQSMGSGGAAAAAAAAAAKLGIPLPDTTVSTMTLGDEDEDDAEGGKGSTKSRSRSWLPSEDELVRALVAQHGPRKWTLIASRLKNKTQKQVYARWRDYLQPGLTTKPWTKEEQERLVELQAHVGNQWAVLARLMPGRSPNAIKNRFHATKRKIERHNRRDGSNLNPTSTDNSRGTSKNTAGKSKKSGNQSLALGVMSEGYSKEEQMAVEGLLLADTPTSMMANKEKALANAQFDKVLDIQDRLRMEATKAAKASQSKR